MGLDAYIKEVAPEAVIDDFKYRDTRFFNVHEVRYWRNNRLLQQWMYDEYRSRGGTSKDFNCEPLRVYRETLVKLLNDNRKLGSYRNVITPEDRECIETKCIYNTDIGAFYYWAWF